MVKGIIDRQNEEYNILSLTAQRNLYSKAEQLVKFEMIIGGLIIGALYFLLPIFLPILLSLLNVDYSSIKPFIGFVAPLFGFIFTIIDIWFIYPEINDIKEKAARVQEDFDCNVLLLPWNHLKIDQPDKEEIILNSDKYKKKRKDIELLKNWYTGPVDDVPLEIGRIMCQRLNCWWDTNLRENFLKILKIVGLGLLVLVIVITLFEAICAKDIITGISTLIYGLFSFLYYCVFLMRQITDNGKSKDKISKIKQEIDKTLQDILNHNHKTDLNILSRQIQDELFDHRRTTPIIFDWYYHRKRDEQELSSAFSVKKMVEEYKLKNP